MLGSRSLLFSFAVILYAGFVVSGQYENTESVPLVNEKVYSSIFARRREEHKTLLNHFERTDKYERKFKLLEVGLKQILAVLRDNRAKLKNENYSSTQGFPTASNTIDALSLVLENVCLFGDLMLHMPDMSEKILSKDTEWKEVVEWAMRSALSFTDVIDSKSVKMLSLLDQEINVEKRTSDYVNPYREQPPATKPVKPKKKLKKGPQLTSRSDL